MVRCSNCQHIFVVYPLPEDTTAEAQRANRGQNRQDNSLVSSNPTAANLKKPVGADRSFSPENEQFGRSRKSAQDPPSILGDLFGLDKPANPQEGAAELNNDPEKNSLAENDDGGEAEPDCEGEEIQYADLPDIAEIENSIDWSDVRAADESNS
jgi:hypothetical protein